VESGEQRGKVLGHGAPEHVEVDFEVVVGEPIACPCRERPRHLGIAAACVV